MHIVASFVTTAQATELVEPSQCALDHPAIEAEATPVRRVALRQERLNAQLPQPFAMRLGVIAPVALHHLGTLAGATRFATHRWNRFHQGLELRHIMRVRSGQDRRQRHASAIGDHMVLTARFAFVGGIRACLGPPFNARTDELSTTARDQSICSARLSFASKTSCKRCQTSAACHSCSRRQQVIPLPQPISCGRSSHPMPVFNTKMMPVRARRLSIGLRPGNRKRRAFGSGNSGSMIAQSSSSTSGFAIDCPLQLSSILFYPMANPTHSFC